MSEEVIRRRAASPQLAAMRAERVLLRPVRLQIGDLQNRAAFLEARAKATRAIKPEERDAECLGIRLSISGVRETLEGLMQGRAGVGPAEDCRKAIAHIEDRLNSL